MGYHLNLCCWKVTFQSLGMAARCFFLSLSQPRNEQNKESTIETWRSTGSLACPGPRLYVESPSDHSKMVGHYPNKYEVMTPFSRGHGDSRYSSNGCEGADFAEDYLLANYWVWAKLLENLAMSSRRFQFRLVDAANRAGFGF